MYIHKIAIVLRNFLKYIKRGGVTNVSLQKVDINNILAGKSIVITGGSDGLGLVMAQTFLDAGAEVLITGRHLDKLESVCRSLNSNRLHCAEWDVTDFSVIQMKLDSILSKMERMDVFINNAAFMSNGDWYNDMRIFDKTIDTNLKSVLYISQAVAEYYVKQQICGKIINISSLNAVQGSTSPYYISKWGVNCITEGLAKKYIGQHVVVNGIAPGFLPTGINKTNANANAYLNTPNQRFVMPSEIAEIALFLASDRANSIVGQTILCDGGKTLR